MEQVYIATVSRGKDSTAMLLAIRELGLPLDAIVSVDVWATQDIPAELPDIVVFKDEWDRKCEEKFGLPVTRICAMSSGKKVSYEDVFYQKYKRGERAGKIHGFPMLNGPWCNSYLKREPINRYKAEIKKNRTVVTYIGIAADEAARVERWGGEKGSGFLWSRSDGQKRSAGE